MRRILLLSVGRRVHSAGMQPGETAPNPAAHWTVFILRNATGRFFIGHAGDLDRFMATADADVSTWTGRPGPWPLVWKHEGLTEDAARKYETSLKRDRDTPRFYQRTGLAPLPVE